MILALGCGAPQYFIMASYRHLILKGVGRAPDQFRAKGVPIKDHITPVENRADHGARLLEELGRATEAFDEISAEQAANGLSPSKRGMLLAVTGRLSEKLRPGEGRPTSPGRKLYGLRRGTGPGERDVATFFLNRSALTTFQKQLTEYSTYETPPEFDGDNPLDLEEEDDVPGRPHGFKLFETAGEIRTATFRDLWTDDILKVPTKRDKTGWEVWVRRDLTDIFVDTVIAQNIEQTRSATQFVEVMVQNVRATPEQIEALVRTTAAIVELRSASQLGDSYFEMPLAQKYAATQVMASRIIGAPGARPRVTLLDTGVDRSNSLLQSSLAAVNCHSVVPAWGTGDHDGHGTKMAGIVQFLDIATIQVTQPIQFYADLESVVVTAPAGAAPVPARWAIEQAVKLVENSAMTSRVFCLAQTAAGEANTGRGTATSAAVDKLAYGDGKAARLFCVAAGNVPVNPAEPYQIAEYDDRNGRFGIESPGQAFNAVTVGGMTRKVAGSNLVAPDGDLSPSSRSANSWKGAHPGKPDIVLEAGNFEKQPGGVFATPSFPNFVLTTGAGGGPGAELTWAGETSAATARASGLAARTMWSYPQLRPETIRGLLVHSAEWTQAMRDEFDSLRATRGKQEAAATTFHRYGWGVPNEERLYTSLHNDFTLVIEDTIQPYQKPKGKPTIRINEMKYFKMPWPRDALLLAGQAQAELKCTLSYFIEPAPHAYARSRYDRYYSAKLLFDVKQHQESDLAAQSVFNDFGSSSPAARRTDGWDIGQLAFRGSLHQDTWHGRAYELADRDGISVAPAKGWWSEPGAGGQFDEVVRFALIVSLRVYAEVDLITETSAKISPRNVVQGLTAVRG